MSGPAIDWSTRGWRAWCWLTVCGAALLVANVLQHIDAAGALPLPRDTWIYRGLEWVLLWLALPVARVLTRRFPFEAAHWGRVLAIHLAGVAGACVVFWLAMSLRLLMANRLPLSFWPEVLRDTWIIDGWLPAVLGYGALVLPLYAADFYTNWQAKQREAAALQLANAHLETRLVRASLEALKMQLHPHFLFNTLNSITALIRRGRTDDAEEIVAGLGELLRRSLEYKQDLKVPLEVELRFLQRYFEIERIRFQDRLQVEFAVPDNCLSFLVPSLVLQPLVENAMKHGFSRDPEARVLRISATRADGVLVLSVYNDGPAPAGTVGAGGGIGLQNTRTRLQMMYGNRASFELQAAGRGVDAIIHIPLQNSA